MSELFEYKCNNCGHEGINTRAVPSTDTLAGLVRYRLDGVDRMIYSEKGDYVLYSEAAAVIERYKKDSGAAIAAMVRNNERAEAAEAELALIKALLKDHNAVHIALLRGDIAKPTAKQINHVYAAPIDQTAEVERLRSIVLSLCDHMEMVNSDLFDRTKSQQNPNISSMRIAIDEARIALSGKESK